MRTATGRPLEEAQEAKEMSYRTQITVDGTIYQIHRDVTHRHPEAVHNAIGTNSEGDLQLWLDRSSVEDWYDAGRHLGPDEGGVEMFRTDDYGVIVITPGLPYFPATFDCDWATARRIAAELGQEHLAAVEAAEEEAAREAARGCDSP